MTSSRSSAPQVSAAAAALSASLFGERRSRDPGDFQQFSGGSVDMRHLRSRCARLPTDAQDYPATRLRTATEVSDPKIDRVRWVSSPASPVDHGHMSVNVIKSSIERGGSCGRGPSRTGCARGSCRMVGLWRWRGRARGTRGVVRSAGTFVVFLRRLFRFFLVPRSGAPVGGPTPAPGHRTEWRSLTRFFLTLHSSCRS